MVNLFFLYFNSGLKKEKEKNIVKHNIISYNIKNSKWLVYPFHTYQEN